MKATIAGIVYEGTYDEITAIVDRMTPRIGQEPNTIKPLDHTGWWGIHPPHTTGQTSAVTNYKCPNEGQPCNCSGACMRPSGMSALGTTFAILDGYMNKSNT